MYRTVNDFLVEWSNSTNGTMKVLEALTDEKLDQAIVEGHNTLGWLGWHIVTSVEFFSNLVRLKNIQSPGDAKIVPTQASVIVESFRKIVEEVKQEVEMNYTDEQMVEKIENFGKLTPRGALLRTMIDHHTHHRGQMTVLLRQAGLKVPGVMGPTKEDPQY
ncbi:damage-inducible protein DinB [Robertmurraya yapensis]|uniref:Damage-inducible protein DinB n=1 Tax=Bacillus yapensis TaxID=2492960 RepID=A0A431WFK3_9BACI|nr:DinB family protein [Bacillus yapensis]RTR34088.1 damage-inducible protein DinB [Bacillus yapensis]TKS97406.1 damage-inducible protein DinB [Bacillus yapensis]